MSDGQMRLYLDNRLSTTVVTQRKGPVLKCELMYIRAERCGIFGVEVRL